MAESRCNEQSNRAGGRCPSEIKDWALWVQLRSRWHNAPGSENGSARKKKEGAKDYQGPTSHATQQDIF